MISDTALIAIIAAIPTTIASITAMIIAIKNSTKIDLIKKATDGMKDELVKATRKEALIEGSERGRIAGVIDEKKRIDEVVKAVAAVRNGDIEGLQRRADE